MSRPAIAEEMRLRALERLYVRRDTIEELIRSLESYEHEVGQRAACVPISASRKCS